MNGSEQEAIPSLLSMTSRAVSQPWTPHAYQLKGVKFAVEHGGGGLLLDPGLGKTSIVLAALLLLKAQGIGPAIVLAPLRVAQLVWPGERDKWMDFHGLNVRVLHGPNKMEYMTKPADVYVLNYEGLDWFLKAGGVQKTGAQILICDESTRLKNSQSKRFKELRKYLNYFKYRWILTGTPRPNSLEDIWAQMYIVDGGATLGRYISHFRDQYMFPPTYGGYDWTFQPGAAERIHEKIKPFMLRMAAEDYLEMPELVENDIMVTLPPDAWNVYRSMESALIAMLRDQMVAWAANAAVAGNKCLQICNGAIYTQNPQYETLHAAKLDALEDLLEELGGAPALLFYSYTHDLERIQGRLGGAVPHLGTGSPGKQAAMVDNFNAGRIPLLLAHPASAGHGLNLQGVSNHIIWFGLPWSLELYDQGIRRVYRQGNPNTHVFIHRILAGDTIDLKVRDVLRSKDRGQQSLFKALLA